MKLSEATTKMQTLCHDGYSLADLVVNVHHKDTDKYTEAEIKNIKISEDKFEVFVSIDE